MPSPYNDAQLAQLAKYDIEQSELGRAIVLGSFMVLRWDDGTPMIMHDPLHFKASVAWNITGTYEPGGQDDPMPLPGLRWGGQAVELEGVSLLDYAGVHTPIGPDADIASISIIRVYDRADLQAQLGALPSRQLAISSSRLFVEL